MGRSEEAAVVTHTTDTQERAHGNRDDEHHRQNLASVEIGKDVMLSHGYIKNDFDVAKWATPEFLEQAARAVLEEP